MQIDWQPTNNHARRSTITDGVIEMPTVSGSWFFDVTVQITGRTLTKGPLGDYGTKGRMTFADGSVVDCWVRP